MFNTIWHVVTFLVGSIFGLVIGEAVGIITGIAWKRHEDKVRPSVYGLYSRQTIRPNGTIDDASLSFYFRNCGYTTIPPAWPHLEIPSGAMYDFVVGTTCGVGLGDWLPDQMRVFTMRIAENKPRTETNYISTYDVEPYVANGQRANFKLVKQHSGVVLWESEELGTAILKLVHASQNGTQLVDRSLREAIKFMPDYFPANIRVWWLRNRQIMPWSGMAAGVLFFILFVLMLWISSQFQGGRSH